MSGVDSLSISEHREGDSPEWMRWPREGESMGAYAEYMAGYLERKGKVVPAADHRGGVAEARADQREATIRHAAEWLRTLGRDDLAVALVRTLSATGGQ